MITVARFSKTEDAHLLRLQLEAGGVQAWLQDEYIAGIYSLWSNAMGGVRVQIEEQDLQQARKIVAEQKVAAESEEFESIVCCPKCRSGDVEDRNYMRGLSAIGQVFMSFPLFFGIWHNSYGCRQCGHVWKEKRFGRTDEVELTG